MNQGEPVSPTNFNLVVDAVVQATFMEFCGPQEINHGLVWVAGEQYKVFYAKRG